MNRMLRCILASIPAFAVPGAVAAERGTPDEAQAMLQAAAAHYQAVGRQRALADFSAGKAPFRHRDLYVVCVSGDYRIAAHGAMPHVVGRSLDVLQDAEGKPLGPAFYDSAAKAAKGEGSLRYRMTNPSTGQAEQKVTFTRKLGSDVCGVGTYTR